MKHVFHGSRSICSLIFAVILIGPLTFYSDTIESSPVESDQVRLVDTPLDRPPLALPNGLGGGFVQNDGQLPDPDILFYYDIPGCSYYFLKDGVMISLVDRGRPSHPTPTEAYRFPVPGGPVLEEGVRTDDIGYTSVCHIFFSFEGSRGVRPEGVDPMTGHFNYLRGMDKDSWITNVHSFSRIVYEEVYRGIDLVFYLKEGLLKYDFMIHPGGNYEDIVIIVEGPDRISINEGGDMEFETVLGPVYDGGLQAFYEDDPSEPIPCSFIMTGPGGYSYELGTFDTDRTIIIDPMIYSTYLGGASLDYCMDVVVDRYDCVYVVGYTSSDDFPTSEGSYQTELIDGTEDAFVAKIDPTGETLLYCTYIGGGKNDEGLGIVVDEDESAIITGMTRSDDFPTTQYALQNQLGGTSGDSDAFVCKLSSDGSSLVFSTYLGGEGREAANAIDIDPDGKVYITGYGESIDFPLTEIGNERAPAGKYDAFLSILTEDGSSLVYSTFIGGSVRDVGRGVTCDRYGNAIIVGECLSDDFPTNSGSIQEEFKGMSDMFVCKFAVDTFSLDISTLIGGSEYDGAFDIATDLQGDLYVVGTSGSTEFPTTAGAYQEDKNRFHDVVLVKMDSSGSSITYSTFLGGGDADWGLKLIIDENDFVYITGQTGSVDFPVTRDVYQGEHGNNQWDAFITKMRADGEDPKYSSFLGAEGDDYGKAIDVDGSGNVLIVGITNSRNFPVVNSNIQTSYGGDDREGFISKLNLTVDFEPPMADAGPDLIVDQFELAEFDGSGSSDNYGIVNWIWRFVDDGNPVELTGEVSSYTFATPGTYSVTLSVVDGENNWANDMLNVTVRDILAPIADAGPDQVINLSTTLDLDGSSSQDNVGIVNWTWSFRQDDILITRYGEVTPFTFDVTGVFSVILNVTDAAGNWGVDELNITVIDNVDPVAHAGADQTIDQHQRATLDAANSTDNVGIDGWNWTFDYLGTVITLNDRIAHYIFDEPGIYRIILTVTDHAGNNATDTLDIVVRDITLPIADAGEDKNINAGDKVEFDGARSSDNVAITKWTWMFDYDGEAVTLDGPTVHFKFVKRGNYTVTLEVEDPAGNSAVDHVQVNVSDAEITPPEQNLTYLILILLVLVAVIIIALVLLRRRGTS